MFSLKHIPYTFLLLIPISSVLAQGLRSEAEAKKDERAQTRAWAAKNTIGFMCSKSQLGHSHSMLEADFFKGGRCSRASEAAQSIACGFSHRLLLLKKDGSSWQVAPWMAEISINPTSRKWVEVEVTGETGSQVVTYAERGARPIRGTPTPTAKKSYQLGSESGRTNPNYASENVEYVTTLQRELHLKDQMFYEKKGSGEVQTYKCYGFAVGEF